MGSQRSRRGRKLTSSWRAQVGRLSHFGSRRPRQTDDGVQLAVGQAAAIGHFHALAGAAAVGAVVSLTHCFWKRLGNQATWYQVPM
jgi:hypothetical protein